MAHPHRQGGHHRSHSASWQCRTARDLHRPHGARAKLCGRIRLPAQGRVDRGLRRTRSPVRSFSSVGGTPLMQTGSGVVAIVPMYDVYWNPEKLISGAGPHGEIWITGSASKLATDALDGPWCPRLARGWKNRSLQLLWRNG